MNIGNYFKKDIVNYIKCDDYIKTQEKKLREYRKKRTELENTIVDYMFKNNINKSDIKVGDSKLRYHENKTKTNLNQNFIKNKLKEYFLEKHSNLGESKCIGIADDIYNYIENSRIYNKKIVLKRISIK